MRASPTRSVAVVQALVLESLTHYNIANATLLTVKSRRRRHDMAVDQKDKYREMVIRGKYL